MDSIATAMIDADLPSDFELFRGANGVATVCPAPLVNLHFSQLGVVTACCFNRKQVLGVYPKNSIREIWEGPAATELREALAQRDLSKGCEKCLQQLQARDYGGSHALFYTAQAKMLAERQKELSMPPALDRAGNSLPMKMEFNIHNACNLECIMCHGLASSAIRTRREGLSPLPNPYDDAFVDQLEAFMPQLVETDFIGGEPFLMALYPKIWERIGQINPDTKVGILTNATVLDDRVKRILESINCWIHLSIDSIYKDTYETIRRGARYEAVMANADYFRDLMAARGNTMYWRLCPMRLNWHELPQTLLHCSEKGIRLTYNQLDSPIGLSLTTLPAAELAHVVDSLEAQQPGLPLTAVGRENLRDYAELIARLRGFLQPENRLAGLRCRLDIGHAVVGQYSRGREEEAREQVVEVLEDRASVSIKNYLITRLNIDLTAESDCDVPLEFSERLREAGHVLSVLPDEMGTGPFLSIYLKELLRTYSGVWGVERVHDRRTFGRIDELIASVETRPPAERRDICDRVIQQPLPIVYHAIGLADSVRSMQQWLEDVARSACEA